MRSRILHIYRGLPGSGKTTLADKIGCIVINPCDDWGNQAGCHALNEQMIEAARIKSLGLLDYLLRNEYDVAVCEVLPNLEYLLPYLDLAEQHTYQVNIVNLKISREESSSRNNHSVGNKIIDFYLDQWVTNESLVPLIQSAYTKLRTSFKEIYTGTDKSGEMP